MADYLVRVSGGQINGSWPWFCDVNGLYVPTNRPSWRNPPDRFPNWDLGITAMGNAVLWRGSWLYGDCWMLTPYDKPDDPTWTDYQAIDWNSPWADNHYRAVALGDEITGEEEWYACGANSSNANPPPIVEKLPVPDFWDAWGWWCWLMWGDGPYFGSNCAQAPCAAVLAGKNYLVLPANQDLANGTDGFVLWQMDGRHEFQWEGLPDDMFPGGFDTYNRGGAFDAGDGLHIYVNGGAWQDGQTTDWQFTFKTFAVIPGEDATETASVTVPLPSGEITNFVEAAPGEYRFLLLSGGNVYFCSYVAGAATYTAGTAVALPALPEYYEDVVMGAFAPKDQSLLKVNDTYYWFRDIHRGTMDRQALPYEVSDGVVTPVADVITIADPIVTNDQAGQSWGYYGTTIYGHFGKDSYNDAGVQWVPGNAATPGASVGYPGAQCWFARAGNGQLYLMGWADETYEHKPFVLKISPTPITVEHGVVAEWTGGMMEVEATARLRAEAQANASGEAALEVEEPEPVLLTVAGEAYTEGAVQIAHDLLAAGEALTEGAGALQSLAPAVLAALAGEAFTEGDAALVSTAPALLADLAGEAYTEGAADLESSPQATLAELAGEAHTEGNSALESTAPTLLSDLAGEAYTEGAGELAISLEAVLTRLDGESHAEGETLLHITLPAVLAGLDGAAHTAGAGVLGRDLSGAGESHTSGRVEVIKYLRPAGGEAHTSGAANIGRKLLALAGVATTEGDADLAHGFTVHGAARTSGAAQLAHDLTGAGTARTRGNAALGHGLIIDGQANATGAVAISRVLRTVKGAARTAGEAVLEHGLQAAGAARTAGTALLRRGLAVAGAATTAGAAMLAHGLPAQGTAQATGEVALAHGLKGAGRAATSGSCQLAHGVEADGAAHTSGQGAIGRVLLVVGAAATVGDGEISHTVKGAGAAHTAGDADLRRGVAGAGAAWTTGRVQIAFQPGAEGEANTSGTCRLAHGTVAIGEARTSGTATLQVWLGVRTRGTARTSGQGLLVRGIEGTDGAARTSGRATLAHALSPDAGDATTSGDASIQRQLSGAGRVRTAGAVVLAHGLCGEGAAGTSGRVKLAHVLSVDGEAGATGDARLYRLLPRVQRGQAATVGEVALLIAPGVWSPLPRLHMDVQIIRGDQEIDLRTRGLHVERETTVMELL